MSKHYKMDIKQLNLEIQFEITRLEVSLKYGLSKDSAEIDIAHTQGAIYALNELLKLQNLPV